MKFTLSAARDFESRGIGLLAGASYVVGALDDALLAELEQRDWTKTEWLPDCRLIVVTGPKGKLLTRFAYLDASGRYLRFKEALRKDTFASLPLLKASAHLPAEFLARNLSSRIRRIRKLKNGQQYTGLLIGDETKHYSSLLCLEPDRLRALDVEPRHAGGGGIEATTIHQVDEEEAHRVRTQFETLLRTARFQNTGPYVTNTSLPLVSTTG